MSLRLNLNLLLDHQAWKGPQRLFYPAVPKQSEENTSHLITVIYLE